MNPQLKIVTKMLCSGARAPHSYMTQLGTIYVKHNGKHTQITRRRTVQSGLKMTLNSAYYARRNMYSPKLTAVRKRVTYPRGISS